MCPQYICTFCSFRFVGHMLFCSYFQTRFVGDMFNLDFWFRKFVLELNSCQQSMLSKVDTLKDCSTDLNAHKGYSHYIYIDTNHKWTMSHIETKYTMNQTASNYQLTTQSMTATAAPITAETYGYSKGYTLCILLNEKKHSNTLNAPRKALSIPISIPTPTHSATTRTNTNITDYNSLPITFTSSPAPKTSSVS